MGLTFIFSGYSKLYPIEPFEFNFVDIGIANWRTAPFIARFIIGFEFALGLLLILNLKTRTTLKATIGLLVFFTLYLIYQIATEGNKGNCGCFGTMLEMTPLESIIKNIALLGISFFLLKLHTGFNWKFEKTFFYISILTSFVMPFILNTVDTDTSSNFTDGKINYKLNVEGLYGLKDYKSPTIDLTKGKHLIAFMSLSCPHCKIGAFKLHILKKQHPEWSIYIIFNGDQESIAPFHKETKSENIPYSLINGQPFIKLSGPFLPAIYTIDNAIVKKKFSYLGLNEKEIAEFFGKK